MTKEEEKQPGETMSDLRERIAEITERNERQAREIRGSDPRFVSTEVRAMVEDVGYLLALLKQKPVAWRHDFTCGHSEFTKQEHWDGTRYACQWNDRGAFSGTIPLYAAPVVPEGERVEGWVSRGWTDPDGHEVIEVYHEHEPDNHDGRAILIFPEDKP